MPIRVQRKRTKGWKMPENTIYVGRPTKWGNPYVVGIVGNNAEDCVIKFEQTMSIMLKQDAVVELKGKNLACFCRLDQPCHADVLLKIANQ
jgi:hypothetical protein